MESTTRSIHNIGKPPKPISIMAAFRINKAPFPWRHAIEAGLSCLIPLLVGLFTGHFAYGLMAVTGGFIYLYASNEPYGKRAVKLVTVMIANALAFGLTAWAASASFWMGALVLAFVSALSVYICEALSVPVPSSFFFIMSASLGTSMPMPLSHLALPVALSFLGGIPAWLIAMYGWLSNPHRPEARAVAGAYQGLAGWMAAVGTDHLHAAQHQAAVLLREAETVVAPASMPRRDRGLYVRLMRLNEQADNVFSAIIALTAESSVPVDPKLTAAVRSLADAVDDPDRAACLTMPQPVGDSQAEATLHRELAKALAIAGDDAPDLVPRVEVPRGNIGALLRGALSRHSLVVPKAMRIAAVLIIAAVVAHVSGTQRPYWVYLTCAAVMLGPSVAATVHRSIQRTIGTIVGAAVGAFILSLHPSGIYIALTFGVLQVLAQLTIARNYGFAILFFTPLGLLLVHAGHPDLTTNYLVSARLIDILLGCALGLIGTMLFGRRTSSKRMPVLLDDAIAREERLLAALRTGQPQEAELQRRSLRTSLINLRVMYDTAVNEMTRDWSQLELLWPALIGVQRLGFNLIALSDPQMRQQTSAESLLQVGQELHEISHGLQVAQLPRS
ncbi:MAG: yvaC [Firmicutes bacterium]|nr:yvaC [Bacillota bacterium]